MLLRRLVLLAGLLGATTVDAGFYTGNILYAFMTSQVVGESGAATAYVAGVADADEFTVTARRTAPQFCIPKGVTGSQAIDVVKKYLEVHPEQRHYPAAGLVVLAFAEVFPCPK